MQLLRAPEPFSPAFGEILYAVSLTENEKGGEISIFNSAVTEKIGIKKATEAPAFTLNVSDYVRSQIRIEPFARQGCGIIDADQRTFYSCIACPDWVSVNPHTAGIVSSGMNETLCEPVVRRISKEEQDEICWIAREGVVSVRILFALQDKEPVEIYLGRKEIADPKMLALIINGADLSNLLQQRGYEWDEFSHFTVEIYASHQLISRIEYHIRPYNSNKIRLAWWNRHGGIDMYTFESTKNILYKAKKEQVVTGGATRQYSCSGHKEISVVTGCSTRQHDQWIAQIIGAPQVWVEQNEEWAPVEILDAGLSLYNPEKTEIEIRFAESIPTPFQSF